MQGGELTAVLGLRASAREALAGCMVRWNRSGEGLLVTDAPRRGRWAAAEAFAARRGLRGFIRDGLGYLELADAAYARLAAGEVHIGVWDDAWFEAQALLASILGRTEACAPCDDGLPLLREAVRACAQGERQARAFLQGLRQADAAALREGSRLHTRGAASVCAQWLWLAGVGLPRLSFPARGDTLEKTL